MKKSVSILLLFVFLFNSMGYYLVFKITQHQIKGEVAGIISSLELSKFTENSTELTKIKVKKSELHKIVFKDKGKEIFLDNKMYDIVKTIETDEHMLYHCLHDKEESILVAGLESHVKSNTIDSKSTDNSSSKNIPLFLKLYFQNNESLFSLVKASTAVTFTPFVNNYISCSLEINSPPPEFI